MLEGVSFTIQGNSALPQLQKPVLGHPGEVSKMAFYFPPPSRFNTLLNLSVQGGPLKSLFLLTWNLAVNAHHNAEHNKWCPLGQSHCGALEYHCAYLKLIFLKMNAEGCL